MGAINRSHNDRYILGLPKSTHQLGFFSTSCPFCSWSFLQDPAHLDREVFSLHGPRPTVWRPVRLRKQLWHGSSWKNSDRFIDWYTVIFMRSFGFDDVLANPHLQLHVSLSFFGIHDATAPNFWRRRPVYSNKYRLSSINSVDCNSFLWFVYTLSFYQRWQTCFPMCSAISCSVNMVISFFSAFHTGFCQDQWPVNRSFGPWSSICDTDNSMGWLKMFVITGNIRKPRIL